MAIEITGLAPLLQVFDMPVSLQFYCGVLGFEVVTASSPPPDCGWVLLRLGPTEIMLNTAYEKENRPAAPDTIRQEAHADAALYFACPDPDAAYAYLCKHGLDLRPPTVAPYGMKQLYLRDPDGWCLCFQWPDPQVATP